MNYSNMRGVYLKAYITLRETELGIGNYMVFYNQKRNYQDLNNLTLDESYFGPQKYAAWAGLTT
ncbi:MAG: hypothetical protein CENE_02764 [Candidatus Celerinatantimonas neptuna]|nr:MAG: hypothetical protein CENE_02764 [Candidatus Celerinatantimonas neptuna]